MKRLYCFLCLLLSLCILFPVFSISLYAQEVDGNEVLTHWYISDPENELALFEDTIISNSALPFITISANIQLASEIEKNNLFDFELLLDIDECIVNYIEVRFFNSNSTLVDTLSASLVDERISLTNLQFQDNIAKVVVLIEVDNPSWSFVNTVYNVTVDGSVLQFEKNMVWSNWCNSSYNTLGLFVENGCVYYESGLDVLQLQYGGVAVNSMDKIDSSKSYDLVELPPAVTYIDFTINQTSLQAESSQTWETWLTSDLNTYGVYLRDGIIYYDYTTSMALYKDNNLVDPTESIIEGKNYTIRKYTPIYTFTINGNDYEFEEGMTFEEWIDSDYAPPLTSTPYYYISGSRVCRNGGVVIFQAVGNNTSKSISDTTLIVSGGVYGDKSYCQGITTVDTFALMQYEFDFSIVGVNVTVTNENGLLNGIIAWLKKTVSSITSLPSNIVNAIGNKLEAWFVPNEDRIVSIKEDFVLELEGRFGVLFDAVDIVDSVANTFVYSGTDSTVTLPSVTVDLAGTPFTFGGYEVDVIPDGFEDLVEALRLVVNITSTWYFVLAMKKRLEEVLQ